VHGDLACMTMRDCLLATIVSLQMTCAVRKPLGLPLHDISVASTECNGHIEVVPQHAMMSAPHPCRFPPHEKHDVEPLMRLSGLEPMDYRPNAVNMRSTYLYIGERCNVAGSSIYKKAIVDGDYDKAHSIALKQVSNTITGMCQGTIGGSGGRGELDTPEVGQLV